MRWSHYAIFALFTSARCLTAQVDSFAARAVIRGIVRDTLGRPYPRIVVNLSRLSVDVSTIGDTTRSWLTIWTDTTDDDGRFEFPPIQPRTYMVIFSKDFFVHGDTTVEIKQPTDTISVE